GPPPPFPPPPLPRPPPPPPRAPPAPGGRRRSRLLDPAPGGRAPSGGLAQAGRPAGRPPRQLRPGRLSDRPCPARSLPGVRMDGPGEPLTLRGSAFLEVVLRAATDDDGRPVLKTTRLRPDFPALREGNAPGSFEGQTNAGVGVSQMVGF